MMRAVLSLTVIVGLLGSPALAQESERVSTDLIYACVDIEDDMTRLACYDESVGRLEAAEKAGEVTTISKAEVEEIERDSFGFSLPAITQTFIPKFGGGDREELAEVVYPVASVRRLPFDKVEVTLENGQIWEQTDSRKITYSKKVGVKDAEIKKAAMGSFKMKLDNGRTFRAKRVR